MDHTHENARPRTAFHMIPERLIDAPGISTDAAMALIYMCTRPIGYVTRTSEIRAALGIGSHRWRKVFRELRDAGAITTQWRRNRHTGRLIGQSYTWDWAPWLGTTETSETDASAQPVDKSTETSVYHASANRRVARRKPTRGTSKTDALNQTRKKEGTGPASPDAEIGRAAGAPTPPPAAERTGLRPDAENEKRGGTSVARQIEILREAGLDPSDFYAPGYLADQAETKP